jgi:dihydrofolate synthase/folylpolyglutamate synthase
MTYRDALNYIYSFTNYEVTPATTYAPEKFNLARMERMLAALGDPHQKFQAVHVAGTKGKGSTAAMIESILRAANHFTGLYTSPHLHTFRERIRVGGEMISQDDAIAGVDKIKPLAEQLPGLTTFEIMTALAFDYFATRGVKLAVLEVGLGGRLDATNIVLPRVSVITSISHDHTAILGSTLAQIAREKAGIIKANVPVVTAPQRDQALHVITEIARERNAPLTAITTDLGFQVSGFTFQVAPVQHALSSQRFTWSRAVDSNFELLTFTLKLLGKHQLTNAATALAAISILREQGIAISDDAIHEGLAQAEWLGRFEILARYPFVIVDSAHNADSAHQLVATLDALFPSARVRWIFATLSDKDAGGIFTELFARSR